MGTDERRKRERRQRMEMILDAAAALIFSKGIDETSMDEIAEKAELSKGTLYLYFHSKKDLVAGLCNKGLNKLKSAFEKAVSTQKTGEEQLVAIGRAYFEFAEKDPDYYDLILYCFAEKQHVDLDRDPQFQFCHQTGHAIHQITATAIRAGLADGTVHTKYHPMELALLLWGQTTGVIQILQQNKIHIEKDFNIKIQRMIDIYFELIRNSIRNTYRYDQEEEK